MSKALLVDDKPENLYFLEAVFCGNGYAVERARNGFEALSSARANPPDLIISDILMPGMDGFALCREWKNDEFLAKIPFVFYTATYTDPKDEQLALGLGADLFLIKPQEPDVFMNEIRAVVEKHKQGELLQHSGSELEDVGYLREYNAALVRKLEDKLLELDRAARVKDILLDSISHELRTPLTPVVLVVDMLIEDPATPPQIREDLQAVRRNVEIEKRLIGDLLDYAAMHYESLRLVFQPLSLHLLIRQTLALWEERVRAKTLQLELFLEATADQIAADHDRIEQVVWNIVHVALRRSPPKGAITLRTSNPEPGCIAINVCDSGSAIEAETIRWAFSPFERGVPVGEGRDKDFGLGLAVAKGIVEAHGGSMAIHGNSKQAVGATIVVQLPLRKE